VLLDVKMEYSNAYIINKVFSFNVLAMSNLVEVLYVYPL
jgi:hypothetical protein